MKKIVFTVVVISGALLMSCGNNKSKNAETEIDKVEVIESITNVVKDKDGNAIDLSFDNDKGTATIKFNGETIKMTLDTVASGVRMRNDNYLYEEWQGHIVLKKDGEVIFDNKDEVKSSASDKEGKKLDMTFNNNNNTATMILNGKTITLNADTTASGVRFSNTDYVFEEWQGHIVLKKDGKVVFDNKK